jgi:ParB family chromosome partitioning protein
LEEPKYSIEQIAARTGKSPAYVAGRLKLTELAPVVVESFYREEIGVSHALLMAKLQPDQQEQALGACFKEDWSNGGQKAKRILLPARNLQFWIESNILLILKLAPFDKRDAELVSAAGSCVDCPKRTGHNKLLFADVRQDACTDPNCYHAKVDAHVAKTVATKPKLVQISTAYGQQQEGSATLPRNKYTEIRPEKPTTKEEAVRPEFKTCKYTTEAIVSDDIDKGEIRKVCTEASCPVHHPKKRPQIADDTKWKAEQEKQRKEAAIASTTGIRILAAINASVPVRLTKRDLLFVVERLASLLDENRLVVVARQHGIKKAKGSDSIGKLFAAYLRRAEESALGGLLVEITILHAATRQNAAQVLRDAASAYKVDVDAIGLKVKQEFAAKEKTRLTKKPSAETVAKAQAKPAKKAKAA